MDRVLEGMEWMDVVSTLEAAIADLLGDTPKTPPACPPPPPPPAPEVSFGLAAPLLYQGPLYAQSGMQSGYPHSQAAVYSQGKYNNVPLVWLPRGLHQNLLPVGYLNGKVLYQVAAGVVTTSGSAAAQPKASMSKKRKHQNQQNEWPYIKKPSNAFMVFRKEQRPNIVAELNISDSVVVNTILGQRWKSLSKEDRAKYYEEANKERLLHKQRHPDWSPRDNYGKKRKRTRRKISTNTEASASQPGEVTQ